MAQDRSYINIPSIKYVSVELNTYKANTTTAPEENVSYNRPNVEYNAGITKPETNSSSTIEVLISDNTPTVTKPPIAEIQPPTRQAPAKIQSSKGGSTPDGLGDIIDSALDNSKLGIDNNDIPSF